MGDDMSDVLSPINDDTTGEGEEVEQAIVESMLLCTESGVGQSGIGTS